MLLVAPVLTPIRVNRQWMLLSTSPRRMIKQLVQHSLLLLALSPWSRERSQSSAHLFRSILPEQLAFVENLYSDVHELVTVAALMYRLKSKSR